jgi:hypothetical protein
MMANIMGRAMAKKQEKKKKLVCEAKVQRIACC